MRKILNTNLGLLLRRIALLYVVLFFCRVAFYLHNSEILGALQWGELSALLIGSLRFDTVSIIYFNAIFVLFSLLPLSVRSHKWYTNSLAAYYIIVNTVAIIINLADAVYFRYTLKRFTADEIFFADNDNSAQLIAKFASENLSMVFVGVVLIAFLVVGYRIKRAPIQILPMGWARFGTQSAILIGAIALMIGGARGGFTRQTRPITLSNAAEYSASPSKANLILSNPFCIVRTAGKPSLKFTEYFSAEELATIYTPYHYPADSSAIDLGKRNIVIFIMESFSAEHSAHLSPNAHPHSDGFTPFLDSLMRGGYTLTNAFSNGKKSIDALPSILASIPSYKTPFVLLPQSLGEGEPLPKILSERGYSTAFFNGSSRGSMGFGAYVNSAGVKAQFAKEDYQAKHGNNDFDGYWGIWDMPFFNYMGEELSTMQQPFFASIFTLTSHHPFVVPAEYESQLPTGKTKAHKAVAYTDLSIRKFFEAYGSQSWFSNTIFVFIADHVSSETFAPETKTPTGSSHIMALFYTPDGAFQGTNDSPTQQLDIMPTLLGLTGYNKPYFAFGRDLINETDREPVVVNFMHQSFQGITDSLVMFFDEKQILSAYSRGDILQETNIKSDSSSSQQDAERRMKAIIQQYYTHVKQKNYVIK